MHEAPARVERIPRVPFWAMVLPAVTLGVGIAIGAAVGGAGRGNTPTPAATATVSMSATPAPTTVEVRVPVECLQLAQEAATALPPIEDAKQAVTNLDFQRIQDYVTKMADAEPHLRDLAQQCRDKSGSVQLGPALTPDAGAVSSPAATTAG